MKNIICVLFIIISGSLQAQKINSGNVNIETRILVAADSIYTRGPSELQQVADSLGTVVTANNKSFIRYWQAYAFYRLGNYFFSRDKSASEKNIQRAIQILEKAPDKNSDEFMLLGSLSSFSINFYPGKAAVLSPQAREYFLKAVELDKNNMRAYYGLGRSDYYRPKEYGGGLIIEENLLKALSLKPKNFADPLAPSWGREDAYVLLINFYLREDRKQEAILFTKKALKEFPQNTQLIALAKKLQQ
jgi:tetratricopeptide (TPR) repeat protein